MPLSFVGVWPLKSTHHRFSLWLLYVVLQISMACADLASEFGDIELMVLNLMMTGFASMMLTRMLVFRYSKFLAPVITALQKDMHPGNYETEEEMQIFWHYYSSAVAFFKIVVSTTCCSGVMFFIFPLEQYFTGGNVN